ncbi:MAG: anaerobic ribonucleoside-triphosphate reductase activating protein [Lachnospiraceae bacterium]|nr:anaerobic ribonucleoside-triphosphate reductase activating protein [Lachnospiraceae bacterium]
MRYHDITKADMLNGDGLRVVLWLSGCSHCCKGCQNPLTWDPEGGLLFDDAAREEIFEQLELSYISGITFSGGDPLHPANLAGVRELVDEIREKYPDKTIWIYTGSMWEDICDYPVIAKADVVVDGEYVEALRDVKLQWKGSSNQRVIDVKKTLASADTAVPVLHCSDYYDAAGCAEQILKPACCGC